MLLSDSQTFLRSYPILDWKDFIKDKTQILEFLGVNMQAKVYINNKLVGSHKGGYTGFRFDVTKYLEVVENPDNERSN